MSLYEIKARRFRAGIVFEGNRAVRMASILRYMLGWTEEQTKEYCEYKSWKCTRVGD